MESLLTRRPISALIQELVPRSGTFELSANLPLVGGSLSFKRRRSCQRSWLLTPPPPIGLKNPLAGAGFETRNVS